MRKLFAQFLIPLFLSYWAQKLWSLASPSRTIGFLFSDQQLTLPMHAYFMSHHLREMLVFLAICRLMRLIEGFPVSVVLLMDLLFILAFLDFVHYMLFYSQWVLFLEFEYGDLKFVIVTVAVAATIIYESIRNMK